MMVSDTISMQEFQNLAGFYRPKMKDIPILTYLTMSLNGEAGEVAEKVKRIYRGDDAAQRPEYKEEIIKELGDVLWNIANIADVLGVSLGLVARMNLEKMELRRKTGVLKGSGDNR